MSYHRALIKARRAGWQPPPSYPPLEAARWLEREVGPEAAPITELAWLHYRVKYGGQSDVKLAPKALKALKELKLPRR